MKALVIIYEFHTPVINNRKNFEDMIRSYERFAFLTNNSCIIFTSHSVVSVRDYLNGGLTQGDKIYVGETSSPAAWNGINNQVSDYIKKNLI